MSANHTPFHTPVSFPTSALKSLKMIVGSLVLTLRRAQLISSSNFWYSALEFGPYACIKHRVGPTTSTSTRPHFLLVGSFINTACQLRAYKYNHSRLGKLLAQHWSRRVSTHCPTLTVLELQRIVKEMPTTSRYFLASSTNSCSFSLSDVMFQFLITSLW